jgi:hypothetical protein
MYLGYFAIAKWAKTDSYRQVLDDHVAVVHNPSRAEQVVINSTLPLVAEAPVTPPNETTRPLPNPPAAGKTPAPNAGRIKDRRKQAQIDYDMARGTVHLQLLRPAQVELARQLDQTEAVLRNLKQTLANSDQRHDTELRQALVRHLVETELHTLPGIGPRLAGVIKEQAFHGELNDLRDASRVEGIGPQKQAAIDNWLATTQSRLPSLLAADFPHKQGITSRFQAERDQLARDIVTAEATRRQQAGLLDLVNKEITRLSSVSVRDFESMLTTPTAAGTQKVNRYLLGAFPPWEPMPDWFAQALEGSRQANQAAGR